MSTSSAVPSVAHDTPLRVAAPATLSADELCERYGYRVYQFASMVARDDFEADDLAQTALERAIRGLHRFDPRKGDVEAWLWRIVVNVARDAGRAALRRQLLIERLVWFHRGMSTYDDIPGGIDDERLLEAVRALTGLQRSVLALRYGADLDYRRVAAALRISPGAATVAGHRALKALRRSLQEDRQ